MAKPRTRLTTPYDSPETLVFRCQKSWRNSNDITPNGGAKERWGRFLAALCGQYLAIFQKRCKIGSARVDPRSISPVMTNCPQLGVVKVT